MKKLCFTQFNRPYGLSSEQCPEVINQREAFGHYEIDTVDESGGECIPEAYRKKGTLRADSLDFR